MEEAFLVNTEANIIDKIIQRGFGLNNAIRITLIMAGSNNLLDAQDRLIVEFNGDFNLLYKCIDILEYYYI